MNHYLSREDVLMIIKKRYFANILDIVFFIVLVDTFSTYIYSGLYSIYFLFLIYIIYFSIVLKISNGFTLGHFLLKLKFYKIDDNEFSIIEGLKLPYLFFFKVMSFQMLGIHGKICVNSLAQFKFDENRCLVCINADNSLNELMNNDEIYYYEYTYYDFIKIIALFMGIIFLFIPIVLLFIL